MVSVSVSNSVPLPGSGIRPVNLRTDLGSLADLIELAFNDTMDSSGRAAIREMRILSRMGAGLNLLSGMNDLTQGISLGYVWVADGRIVGNVSIYPSSLPGARGRAWIIANVAVHPDYRRRGIARELMHASMDMIRQRGGLAILQVEADNDTARRLYAALGFRSEGAWTLWRRTSSLRVPPPPAGETPFITRRRPSEWRAEFALAERVRGLYGLGWQRPLHPHLFQVSLWRDLIGWFSLHSVERLVIRTDDEQRLRAALWIDSGFAQSAVALTLLVDAPYQGRDDEALLGLAVRRYGTRQPLTIEHPADDTLTEALLVNYNFRLQRRLVYMRWDV